MSAPILTAWRGYRFRSRLEAKWAVFFEALELGWEYEPEGFELSDGSRYLPDFKVRYPGSRTDEIHFNWFEVKPDLLSISERDWQRMALWEEETEQELMLLDGTPDLQMYFKLSDLTRTESFPSEKYEQLQGKEYIHQREWGAEIYKRHLPVREELADGLRRKRCGWALWSSKGRLWWDEHGTFFPDLAPEPLAWAVNAARAARFEFADAEPFLTV